MGLSHGRKRRLKTVDTKQVNVVVSADNHSHLRELAQDRDISVGALIELWTERAWKKKQDALHIVQKSAA